MEMQVSVGKIAKICAIGILSISVAGCFGPTYGTGKTSGEHLMNDLSGALSLKPKGGSGAIEYNPRPSIVKPADTSTLPAPQQSIAETSPEWPETQAQKRARILADIEAGRRPANFVTNSKEAAELGASEGPSRNAGSNTRRFLTDPPVEYRVPAETAATDQLGQTEASKARAARAQSGGKSGWRRLVPWL